MDEFSILSAETPKCHLLLIPAFWDTEWDACRDPFSQQLCWVEKREGKSLLHETKKPGEAGLSRDVQGHGQKVLWWRAALYWGRDRSVTHWHWHGMERQQGGTESGGERAGFGFSPLCQLWGDVSGVRQ